MEQLKLFQTWEYDIDTGTVMARCPECTKRIPISYYSPHNYYKFCPYCGIPLEEGRYKRGADLEDD